MTDRNYLERWEPSAPGTWEDRHSLSAWTVQWAGLRSLARQGYCLPFTITLEGEFVGQVTIGNVIRSSLRSAWVGYWVASAHASKGVATAATALAVDHAFHSAGLHRLEAAVQPDNVASIQVLTKLGLRKEGLFERYLEVGGDWRDHLCFAITTEETGSGLVPRLVEDGRAERV